MIYSNLHLLEVVAAVFSRHPYFICAMIAAVKVKESVLKIKGIQN
jgi:hypothetical protein